jgi:hypothetical protein
LSPKREEIVELGFNPDAQIVVATASDGLATFGHAVHGILITIGELRGADFFIRTHRVTGPRDTGFVLALHEFFAGIGMGHEKKGNKKSHTRLIGAWMRKTTD